MSWETLTGAIPTDRSRYRQGGHYGNIDISGSAHVRLGDVYNQGGTRLRYVEGATYDARGQVPRPCHPETRMDLLQNVRSWAQTSDSRRIFWLRGMAGTGKSTISYTVAKWLDNQPLISCCLGASFFFKRGERDRTSAGLFFPTIVHQLALKIPELKTLVNVAIDSDPDICAKALSEQYNKLLSKPLQKLPLSQQNPIYIIVVDALDECEDEEDISILLQLLRTLVQSSPMHIRVFLTSRPELSIRLSFRQMPSDVYEDLILHELPSTVIWNDIFTFMKYELTELRDQYNIVFHSTPISKSWPGSEILETLTDIVDPLFIVATTLCRFIGDRKFHPEERLDRILQSKSLRGLSKLGLMYHPILAQLTESVVDPDDRDILHRQFKLVVGSIINMEEPLQMKHLASLLDIEVSVIEILLHSLTSVLWVSTDPSLPIRPLHLSFSEYLCSEGMTPQTLRIDRAQAHLTLLRKCLHLLEKCDGLHENICCLSYPGHTREEISVDLINDSLSPPLQYACRYWIHHAVHSNSTLSDYGDVHKFLQVHFLHWLEALSLMNLLAEAIPQLQKLESVLINAADCVHISNLIGDARRFVLSNRRRIAIAPLQVYSSAITFAPQNSVVKRINDRKPKWIVLQPQTPDSWGAELQKLEGHTDTITDLKFSPDGLILASASTDGTVRLWDVQTGHNMNIFEGHTAAVNMLAFSPDASLIASASDDQTVRLWNIQSGQTVFVLHHLQPVHWIFSFSQYSNLISVCRGGVFRMWSIRSGQIEATSGSENETIEFAQILPDYSTLAFFTGNEATLRDLVLGKEPKTITIGRYYTQVAFSSCTRFLAMASFGGLLQIQYLHTNAKALKLDGDSNSISDIAFSPDSKLLVSGSDDSSVRVWDTQSGRTRHVLQGHSSCVGHVAFSNDGKIIASGSLDSTICLWDPYTGELLQILVWHVNEIIQMKISPNDSMLASSAGNSIIIWDLMAKHGNQLREYNRSRVLHMEYSFDGSLLVCRCSEDNVKIWNLATGQRLYDLENAHLDNVTAVACSPVGPLFALGWKDGTIGLWNVNSLRMVWRRVYSPAEVVHTDVVQLLFSPNGSILASLDDLGNLKLWDSASNSHAVLWEQRHRHLDRLAFSSDSSLIAFTYFEAEIKVWDVRTGALVWRSGRPEVYSFALAFSLDGQFIASASFGGVKIWNLKNRREAHGRKFEQPVDRIDVFEGDALLTEHGWFQIGENQRSSAELSMMSRRPWVIEGSWLTYRGQKYLWLPEEYRGLNSIIHGSTMATRHPSGSVSIMRFRNP